jgi:hypothetical protein
MLTGLRSAHVGLIARYWVRFSVRTGGGLMTLCLVLMVGLGVGAAFISPIEQVMKTGPSVGHTELETADFMDQVAGSDQVVGIVKWITGDEGQARYLLREQPALLSAIFVFFLILFPFVATVAGFNQTAGDIGTRGLRYLLLRTERPNVFLGRFVGTVGFVAFALALTFLVLLVYVALRFRIYAPGELVAWTLQGYLACFFLCLPYVALCAWLSGLLDGAFAALSICQMVVGFPILFLHLADANVDGDQSWLLRLLPWGWKYDLLDGDLGTRAVAYAVMVGFTLLFLALGLRAFGKRDL